MTLAMCARVRKDDEDMKSKPQSTRRKFFHQWLAWIKQHQVMVAIIGLLTLGFITRFFLFGYPSSAVFDEVYFGKFVGNYFSGSYFFDIHPPFGKLLIAGFAWVMRYNPTSSFAAIGTAFSDNGYLLLRFLPSLAGALLPLVFYGIAREFGLKNRTAFLIGLAVILDNALLAQSRFVLIDSLLLLFGFASLWAYLVWRRRRKWQWIVGAAALAGMAVSVKWTAAIFLALPIIIEVLRWVRWQRFVKVLAVYFAIPVLLYLSFFVIHVSLLTKTGDGDVFMTPAFQSGLRGNQYASTNEYRPLNLPAKIVELNYQMYAANQRLTAGHPYGSKWYTWPIMLRPISYWVEGTGAIWLIGNPLVWWGSLAGLLTLIGMLIAKKLTVKSFDAAWIVLIGFAISWLPFAAISRVMFLYHYFIPLGFAILAAGIVVDRMSLKEQTFIALLLSATFLLFAPASYGIAINQQLLNLRSWLPTWR